MIDYKKFEDLGWKFKESLSYHCIDFKSPRMKEYEAFYAPEDANDIDLESWELQRFIAHVSKNIYTQLFEVKRNLVRELTILARKNQELPEKLKVSIDIYT